MSRSGVGEDAGNSLAISARGPAPPATRGDRFVLAGAVLTALCLGLVNNSGLSYWHDELVQVYLARGIVETGRPVFPSGVLSTSYYFYHLVLAAVMWVFGDGEAAMRAPSAVAFALCVALSWALARDLLGRHTGATTAWIMALCPWTVAWARQARPYTLQQMLYVAMLLLAWRGLRTPAAGKALGFAAAAIGAFTLGLATLVHSVLFLPGPAAYLALRTLRRPGRRLAVLGSGLALALAAGGLLLFFSSSQDRSAILVSGLGGQLIDPARQTRNFYLLWFWQNLSRPLSVLALGGFLAMLVRERERGAYAALAFWAPWLVLTLLVGYRRPRFMFFAFPLWTVALAYGVVLVAETVGNWRRSPRHAALACAALAVAAVATRSGVLLTRDTIEAAAGSHVTLARRHPQWRQACAYVRRHLSRTDALLTTTFLPALHYIGHVDNWYPSAALPWEEQESGMKGLRTTEELVRFIEENPSGYYVAERVRLVQGTAHCTPEEKAWFNETMLPVPEASTSDVFVFRWGYEADEPETRN